MTDAEYQAYLDDQNRKYVLIGCSEIPLKVVSVVRAHYENKGIRASEEAILEEARDKYDWMYLKPDGTYKHVPDWRKYFREKGVDPDVVEKGLLEHFDEYYETLKATDPEAYQEWLEDARRNCEVRQKLIEARQERYREVHQISERDRLERTKLIAK